MPEDKAFNQYSLVRNELLNYIQKTRPDISSYWKQEVSSLDYLFHASPTLVSRWREHCFWLTGDLVYRYKAHHLNSSHFEKISFRVSKFKQMYPNYKLVEEPKVLSGFGFEIDSQIFNIDVLKFNEATLAITNHFSAEYFQKERYVLEVGGGWGGMAHVFKSTYPKSKIIIVDLPEVLLFSAVWLRETFPSAKIDLCTGSQIDLASDFVLVPNTNLDAIRGTSISLLINICSFQEMTRDQIRDYARTAINLDIPFIYSLNRAKGPYNEELTSVIDSLKDFYPQMRKLEIFPTDYTKLFWNDEPSKTKVLRRRSKKSKKLKSKPDNSYEHLVFQQKE